MYTLNAILMSKEKGSALFTEQLQSVEFQWFKGYSKLQKRKTLVMRTSFECDGVTHLLGQMLQQKTMNCLPEIWSQGCVLLLSRFSHVRLCVTP